LKVITGSKKATERCHFSRPSNVLLRLFGKKVIGRKKMKQKPGFTILEASIVMAIMAMTIITIPAFYAWFRGQGAGLVADQLFVDLQQARIRAVNQRLTCAVEFHMPGVDQYTNTLNQRVTLLSGYRGGVCFLAQEPDGTAAASQIAFNSHGISTSVAGLFVFLADEEGQEICLVRVLGLWAYRSGRWSGEEWK
jgi:Tfp pilus assembly protein FimT